MLSQRKKQKKKKTYNCRMKALQCRFQRLKFEKSFASSRLIGHYMTHWLMKEAISFADGPPRNFIVFLSALWLFFPFFYLTIALSYRGATRWRRVLLHENPQKNRRMQEKDETQAGKRRLLFKWRRWLEFNKKRERQLRALQINIPRYMFYFIRELVNSVSSSVPAISLSRAQLTSSR